jgi:DNA-binding MarR family transcriptional regulator
MRERNTEIAELASELRLVVRTLLHRLRTEDTETDLTVSQRSALSRIDSAGSITLSALAAMEAVRPQSMSATVTYLEDEGYIQRAPDPLDGRQQLLSLTKAAKRKLEQSRADRTAWLTRAIEQSCSATERRALAAALPVLRRLTETEQ